MTYFRLTSYEPSGSAQDNVTQTANSLEINTLQERIFLCLFCTTNEENFSVNCYQKNPLREAAILGYCTCFEKERQNGG